jgi:hypothetical protein
MHTKGSEIISICPGLKAYTVFRIVQHSREGGTDGRMKKSMSVRVRDFVAKGSRIKCLLSLLNVKNT